MQFPFLRIAIFLILGIFSAYYYDFGSLKSLIFFSGCISAFLVIYFFIRDRRKSLWQSLSGFIFLGSVFFFGYSHYFFFKKAHEPEKQLYENLSYYNALIIDNSEIKGKYYRTIVEVLQIYKDHEWHRSSGKVLLYHPIETKDETSFVYGDLLLIKGNPNVIAAPSNPKEFDYRAYLQNENIYFQHFLKQDDFYLVKNRAVINISFYIKRWRKNAVAVFEKYITGRQERSIALALVLGVKNELDSEIKQAYAASGAMHILAVSGLHVGMIYGIILVFFGRIKKIKGGNLIFAILAISLLWIYAGITGLPASVLRAVTMFSVIIVSQINNKQTNIYNSLAIAAVVLLVYNPLFLFSVGFQLSFLAVTGIIYLFRWLYHLANPDNYFVDKAWALCCVSFAAQVATFPLSLYYFNQFPIYFFLSNLVVIPAAFVILSTGLTLLLINGISELSNIIAFVLENTIWIVNKTIFGLQFLPHHTITGIYISPFQTFLLYLFFFLFAFFVHKKKFGGLVASFIAVFAFFLIALNSMLEQKFQKKIVVYNIPKHTAIDFIQGYDVNSYIDVALIDDPSKIMFHIAPYRLSRGVNYNGNGDIKDDVKKNLNAYKNIDGIEYIVWNGFKIIVVNKLLDYTDVNFTKLETDFLILRNNKQRRIDQIFSRFDCKLLILDSSFHSQLIDKIEEQAKQFNIAIHSMNKNGALIIDF